MVRVTYEYECDACEHRIGQVDKGLTPFDELLKVGTPSQGWCWINGRLYCNRHEVVIKRDGQEEVVKAKVEYSFNG